MRMNKEKIYHYYKLKEKYLKEKSDVPNNAKRYKLKNIEYFFSQQLESLNYVDYHRRQEYLFRLLLDIQYFENIGEYKKIKNYHKKMLVLLEENIKDLSND
ncbi:hypothetical protein N9A28_02560 [Sulfurimonas sp.]|nr:hypothetical protein [Sulfurimonas sp.]